MLFHQTNASAYKSDVAIAAVHSCGFTLLDHPPYSADIATTNHDLFPNMKKHIPGRHYRSDEIAAVAESFRDQDESFYTAGTQGLQHR